MEPTPATIQQHVMIVSYTVVFFLMLGVILALAWRIEVLKAEKRRQRREYQRSLESAASQYQLERSSRILALCALEEAEEQEMGARLRELSARLTTRRVFTRPTVGAVRLAPSSKFPAGAWFMFTNQRS